MQKKTFSAEMKAKIAIEALKSEKTVNEIAKEFDCSPSQVSEWKKRFLEEASEIFASKKEQRQKDYEAEVANLHQKIGQLTVENSWMKKKYEILFKGKTPKFD